MPATKRDVSGVFNGELKATSRRMAAVLDSAYYLDQKGITFISDRPIPEWTEVGVELRIPQRISCRAVVVECVRCNVERGYKITLLFLNLPKRARSHLHLPLAGANATRVYAAR